MKEQTKVKPSYAGICKFCRGEYESEPPSFDFSSIKILGPGETASMEAEGTANEDSEDDEEELEDSEDDEDYDKFDLEEEFDPMLLETIPADIVEKLRTIHSRDDASNRDSR